MNNYFSLTVLPGMFKDLEQSSQPKVAPLDDNLAGEDNKRDTNITYWERRGY